MQENCGNITDQRIAAAKVNCFAQRATVAILKNGIKLSVLVNVDTVPIFIPLTTRFIKVTAFTTTNTWLFSLKIQFSTAMRIITLLALFKLIGLHRLHL